MYLRVHTSVLLATIAVLSSACFSPYKTIADLATRPLPADSAMRADRVGLLHHGIDATEKVGVQQMKRGDYFAGYPGYVGYAPHEYPRGTFPWGYRNEVTLRCKNIAAWAGGC